MKIFLVSDVHGELEQDFELPDEQLDVVVLAGDIEKSTMSVLTARWAHGQSGAPVIQVAGNHEFYGSDYVRTLANIRHDADELEHIHFLERNSVVIGGVRFLGCTLWTNFELYGIRTRKKMMKFADMYINDFRKIALNGAAFRPEDALQLFQESYTWLEDELAKPFEGKTVVITHFAPHRAAIHSRYMGGGGDQATPYFTPDCSELMRKYDIAVWMYGHTHNSVDTIVEGKTRLVSNQFGYPREDPSYVNFDPNKIIVV